MILWIALRKASSHLIIWFGVVIATFRMFFTGVFDLSFSGDQLTLSAPEIVINANKSNNEPNFTLEELEQISLNILENNIVHDVSATITQDKSDCDATYDPHSDMGNYSWVWSWWNWWVSIMVSIFASKHFIICCWTCSNSSNPKLQEEHFLLSLLFLFAYWLPHGQLLATVVGGSLTNPMLITIFWLISTWRSQEAS